MALLWSSVDDRVVHLPSRCLVGRSTQSALALTDSRVSWEHARLDWNGRTWELRDLGSSNGTFIDGASVAPGRAVEIEVGMVLSFGQQHEGWTVKDAAGPVISAECKQTGEVRLGDEGLLVLPSEEEPIDSIFRDLQGAWVLETSDDAQVVQDLQRVTSGGKDWILRLPEAVVPTLQMHGATVTLRDLTLRFGVSRDEEQVALEFLYNEALLARAENVYNYLLLTLARQRLADRALPNIDDGDQGWIYRDDLCRMLVIDQSQLNMHVFRARKLLSRKGVSGAAHLVERRTLTRQLRLGTRRVEIAQA